MPLAAGGGYQQGAVATVAIYDRQGRRLGTVYLASGATAMPPSSGGSLIQFFLFPLDAVFNKVAPFAV